MEFTAHQISELIGGKIEGNPDATVNKLSKIEEGEAQSLTFLANPAYLQYIYETDATIVILNNDFELEKPIKNTCTLIRVENAYECFAKLLNLYNKIKHDKTGIEQPSFIDETATIGENVYIGAFAYIGKNVVIEDNVKIYPHCYIGDNSIVKKNTILNNSVKIYNDTVIGQDCMIHSGVVIGADGFGFTPNSENNYEKVAQIGNVVIEDHVEIGANTTIDRATLGSTIIKRGVKIDNLVQIAHNVVVGENTVIAAQTGIAGSTKVGKNCMIGGQVGIVGHITIADGVKIAAQSGIGSSIKKENEIVQGSPAFSIGDYKRAYVGFRKLPELLNKIDILENQLKEFKAWENKKL